MLYIPQPDLAGLELPPQDALALGASIGKPLVDAGDCDVPLDITEARQIHLLLKSLQAGGNEIRLALIGALRKLRDGSLCFELGYASYHQYCDREMGLSRSTAYEYARVAAALDGLPQTRRLFREGELSWEQVRATTRVAQAETEAQWIELAWTEPVRVLLSEVREARRTGRDAPRDRRFGLPNLLVDLGVTVTLEEKALVRAAFTLVAEPLGAAVAEDGVLDMDLSSLIVKWADAVLAGSIVVVPAADDRGGRNESGNGNGNAQPAAAQTIVYHTCPECRQSSVETQDGRVSVSPERIAALEPVAERVSIDAHDELRVESMPDGEVDSPNTARLRRQVLHREGMVCANPACGRTRDLHAHHLVHRADGGRTALSNEVAVCSKCHAMIHAGLLDVSGGPSTGLEWTPRPVDPAAEVRSVVALRDRARQLAQKTNGLSGDAEHSYHPGSAGDGVRPMPSQESRRDNAISRTRVRDLAYGLQGMGYSLTHAKESIGEAITGLLAKAHAVRAAGNPPPGPLTDEAILLRALRGRPADP